MGEQRQEGGLTQIVTLLFGMGVLEGPVPFAAFAFSFFASEPEAKLAGGD